MRAPRVFRRHCCFGGVDVSITVGCHRSKGERELGERGREPVPRVNVGGKFVVAAANILDKSVTEADHPYVAELLETTHRRSRAFNLWVPETQPAAVTCRFDSDRGRA